MSFTIEKNGAAAVCTTSGAELISFKKDSKEYVWQGDPAHWSGQAPVLFPVVCSAKDNTIIADGVTYPMPKHGIARSREFNVVEVTPDSVTMELLSDEETMKSYPYSFRLLVAHTVREDGFDTEYTVENTGNKTMHFCIGGHPGFNCPMNEGESFEDYSLYFANAEGSTVVITEESTGYMSPNIAPMELIKNGELPLRYSDYDKDALIIEHLPERSVKLVNRATGKGIRFDFDSFDALGIWTPIKKNSPFICLEPWNGLPASTAETAELTNKAYVKTLDSGKSFKTSYHMTLI